MFDSTSALNNI